MPAASAALGVALAVLAVATMAEQRPFEPALHAWGVSLGVALAAIALAVFAFARLRWPGPERFAAVAALGAVVIALAFLAAELFVGPPQRIHAAPGQLFVPAHSAHVSIALPALAEGDLAAGRAPTSLVIRDGAGRTDLAEGDQARVRSFVFRADSWPAAYVRAWSQAGVAQTVTQPTGVAFVSPVLQFPTLDTDGMLVDSFSVPASHRDVRLKYYPGLPSRGIDIPFLQLQIDEENGSALFDGVAVSGRPVKRAGLVLLFDIGTYPVVSMAGAPDRHVYVVGMALVLAGLIGAVASTIAHARAGRS